jgi:hypothetical protein
VAETQPPLVAFFNDLVGAATVRQDAKLSPPAQQHIAETLASLVGDEHRDRGLWALPKGSLAKLVLDAEDRHRTPLNNDALWTFQVAGSASLVIAGFFPEQFSRRPVTVWDYVCIGRRALSHIRCPPFPELVVRFPQAMFVVREVRLRCDANDPRQLVGLYARWLETRSPHLGQILEEHGIGKTVH